MKCTLVLLWALAFVPTMVAAEDYLPPSSNPQDLHVFGEHVYFSAEDGIHGRELWRSDVEGNAELVADITPGSAGSAISKFATFNDVLLFRVDPEEGGSELWRTDGTAEGTVRVKQFDPNINEGFDDILGIWDDGKAFIRVMASTASVWVTDGTEAGTQPLPMTTTMAKTPVGFDYFGLIHQDAFFFTGNHPMHGYMLARCDREGRNVKSVGLIKSPAMEPLALDENRLLFRSSDENRTQELFIYDGTDNSTQLLLDIAPGPREGFPSQFTLITTLGEVPRAIFAANDSVHGMEPWITDGTVEGTRMLADIMEGTESSRPNAFVVEDNRVVFVATSADTGKELWMGSLPFATVELLADIRPGPEGSDPYAICLLPGRGFFFSAFDGLTGEELYFANPSRRVVRQVRDIYPGEKSSYPYYTVAFGDMVVFAATDPVHGRELWCADGEGNARLLADIYTDGNVNPSSSPRQLTPAGDNLYFVADDIVHGAELWVSDGSAAGTRLVKDIFPGRASSAPQELTALGNHLYFTAEDPVNGFRLWRTDGSTEGTVVAAADADNPQHLIAVGDLLFFAAAQPETGLELWAVGSAHPAALVRDIAKGETSSRPRNMAAFQGELYFLADDGIHGEELWRSDGTEAGTIMVRDIAPAPYEAIRFESLAPSATDLYFAANNGAQGLELWRYNEATKRPVPVKDIATWDSVNVVNPPKNRP